MAINSLPPLPNLLVESNPFPSSSPGDYGIGGPDFSLPFFGGDGFPFGSGGQFGGGSGITGFPPLTTNDQGGGLFTPIGGGSGGIQTVTFIDDAANALKKAAGSVLGIPAINWGRIAAFLLGLILIAGGIYLIKPVNEIVAPVVKRGSRAAIGAIAA